MTPEEAYSKYPESKQEIKKFVESSKMPADKLSLSMDILDNKDHATRHGHQAIKIEDAIVDIKNEVARIFEKCGIKRDERYSDSEKMDVAFRLFKYVIENSHYDGSIMDEKLSENDIYTMTVKDIHRCLCQHRSVCTSDAASLSFLLEQAGISSRHVTIAEKGEEPSGVHEVATFNVGGENYICDPTLTRSTLDSGIIPDVKPSVFAFSPNVFFNKIYPTREVKYEHENISL